MLSRLVGFSPPRLAAAGAAVLWTAACATEVPVRRVGILYSSSRLAGAAEELERVLLDASERRPWRVEVSGIEPVADRDALGSEAARLVDSGVDVLVAVTTAAALAATRAVEERGRDVPVVFCLVSDPVGAGLVSDLSHPGGNVTGVRDSGAFLAGKRLEYLVRTHPGVRKVLVVHTGSSTSRAILSELWGAAEKLDVRLVIVEAGTPEAVDAAYRAVGPGEVDAVYVPSDVVVGMGESALRELVSRDAVPTIVGGNSARSAILGFGAPASESGVQAALLVAKILDGIPPGDIPVERARNPRFRLFVRNARELGYTFGDMAWWLADEIVDE